MGILVVLSPLRLTSGEGRGQHNAAVTALTEEEVLLRDCPGQLLRIWQHSPSSCSSAGHSGHVDRWQVKFQRLTWLCDRPHGTWKLHSHREQETGEEEKQVACKHTNIYLQLHKQVGRKMSWVLKVQQECGDKVEGRKTQVLLVWHGKTWLKLSHRPA